MTAAARPLNLRTTVTDPQISSEVPDLLFVAVLGLLGIVGFRTVYGGWSWLIAGGVGLAAGIALGVVGRRRKLDALLIALATIAVYFVLSGVAISQESVGRVLPTPATARGAANGAVWGWAELLTTVPPVGQLGNLGVVPMLCALVGGVLATSAALRTSGIVRPLVPLVGLVVVAILFGIDEPASLVLQGAAFAAVAIGWIAYRRRGARGSVAATIGRGRAVGGVLMVGLAAVTAASIGGDVPGLDPDRFTFRELSDPPFDPKQQASPLASFAQLKSDRAEVGGARERTLFTVQGLPDGVPLRLAVMDTYDGVVWKVAGGADGSVSASGAFERVGVTLPPVSEADLPDGTDTARVQITVEDYNDIWVPDIGSVTGIQFGGPRAEQLGEELRFNRTTNVGAVPLRFSKGDRIIVDAAWSKPPVQGGPTHPYAGTAAGAAAVGSIESIAEGLPELAERILASGTQPSGTVPDASAPVDPAAPPPGEIGSGFDSVLRVAQEFVISPGYGYSDGRAEDNEAPSVSGHSQRRMSTFADEALRSGLTFGNDEHYASALALIANELRVPARVVMGFCRLGCAGGKVTGNDVSAWVEVNLDGVGWVPVDATPSPDKPELAPVKPKPKPKPKNASQPPPPPVTVPPPEEVIADNVSPKKNKRDSEALLDGAQLVWVAAVGSPVIAVGAFIGGVVMLKRRRRRRRREEGDELHRVVGGWKELDDRALDLGRPLPTRVTRREVAHYLGSDAARHSAHLADAAIWGAGVPTATQIEDYWTSIDAAYDGIAAEESGLRRVRAGLNPASLIRSSRRRATGRFRWRLRTTDEAENSAVERTIDLRETVDA